MLKDDYRLRRDEDFSSIYRYGKKKYNQAFNIFYRRGLGRAGIVVSKKHGNAVKRNLLKRRVRAILANEMPKLKRYDMIIVPKVGALELCYKDLRRNLLHILKIGELYK